MSCADDPVPLTDATVAARAARLCATAEAAHAIAGGEAPIYVIGTEVPVPGGAQEALDHTVVTQAKVAVCTLETHRTIFAKLGLGTAWTRVIALVVQPGVEFDHEKAVIYDSGAAEDLSRLVPELPGIVFEAHSTDYQPAWALAALVRNHFAILKVGPGVTFALREALWGLDAVEREWIAPQRQSRLRDTVLIEMRADDRHWRSYYDLKGAAIDIELQYSLSDRVRYYWPLPSVQTAVSRLLENLASTPPPPALLRQYLPVAFQRLYQRGDELSPVALIEEHIGATLDDYYRACAQQEISTC
jgi:D-tagatose-1,6-bisphosphate aldolase subunit GatZ/KbaZ